jgi:Mg-chelatase subunit ChlD
MNRLFAARSAAGSAALIVLLAACAGGLPDRVAVAGPNDGWPPAWNGQDPPRDEVVRFDPPSASHCRRAPTTREVSGGSFQGRSRDGDRERRTLSAAESATLGAAIPLAKSAPAAPAVRDERAAGDAMASEAPARRQRPAYEPVTAGMVDDNADFGAYLAFRQRNTGLAVRDRDVSERLLLEVTDSAGRPVHDAEVAVQRTGRAEPLAWARTDTAGRVWLHPRVFAAGVGDPRLGIAVRKGDAQARAMIVRGQAQAVQVRLAAAPAAARPRLDLVYLIDATGSMDDEIAKLKASMRAVADQIARLPVRPDLCFGLVAYRDRGDAFLTRTHDFTDDLAAFQGVLGRLRAGGGGDKPEALNEALHEVVHGLSWRADAARMVVLVADAAPHLDYAGPQYDIDMQAALAKGIKVFAVGASGLEPEGEYIYRQMAQYTAGRFVFLTYRDADDPSSGPGAETVHDVKNYSVQTLDRLIVRLVGDELARLAKG